MANRCPETADGGSDDPRLRCILTEGHAGRHYIAPHAGPSQLDGEVAIRQIQRLSRELTNARRIVEEQAEDEALWFTEASASEAYLQQALRRLQAAVEGDATFVPIPGFAMPPDDVLKQVTEIKDQWLGKCMAPCGPTRCFLPLGHDGPHMDPHSARHALARAGESDEDLDIIADWERLVVENRKLLDSLKAVTKILFDEHVLTDRQLYFVRIAQDTIAIAESEARLRRAEGR